MSRWRGHRWPPLNQHSSNVGMHEVLTDEEQRLILLLG